MTSLLHQLDNTEAILLMYVANELTADDVAKVEQMLAEDASMRAHLARLRGLQEDAIQALQRGDVESRLPSSPGVAVRRVTRMMRQWQTDHLKREPVTEPLKELRFPWWSYPLTTAAAVLIAFLVWWGNRTDRPSVADPRTYEEVPAAQDLESWQAEAILDDLQQSFDVSEDDLMRMAMNRRVDETVEWLTSASDAGLDAEMTTTN